VDANARVCEVVVWEETGVPWRNVPFQPGEMTNSRDVSCTRVLNINYYLSTIH